MTVPTGHASTRGTWPIGVLAWLAVGLTSTAAWAQPAAEAGPGAAAMPPPPVAPVAPVAPVVMAPPPPAPPVVVSPAAMTPVAVSPAPSPFETGMRGFSMGLAAGLAGGYLVARENGFHSSDWRPLVAGAGIGALAGGALGLGLGLAENNSATPGRGFLVMRGMAAGGGFGLVAGAIIGGLAALKTDKPEHILLGAAIGTLSGTALGLILGSVEHNPWAPGSSRGLASLNVGVSPYLTELGELAFGPLVSGHF